MRALGDPPAVVALAGRARLEVDLLEAVLADVGDVEVAGAAVEAEAERIAEPEIPDVGITAADVSGRRRRVRVDVDTQDLAELGVEPLPVVHRIAAAAAVAEPDVQEPVGPEGEHAAVVVRERLRDREEDARRRRLGDVGIRRAAILGDDGVARGVRIVHEEATCRHVLRLEGETEEAALAAG